MRRLRGRISVQSPIGVPTHAVGSCAELKMKTSIGAADVSPGTGNWELKMKIKSILAATAIAVMAATPATAVLIEDVTTNTVLFYDNFETGPISTSSPVVGTWSAIGSSVTAINSPVPGPAEGNSYAQLFRNNANLFDPQGRIRGQFATLPSAGDLIRMSMMVYVPSSADQNARFTVSLNNGGAGTSYRAYAETDGAGHVKALGPGSVRTDTGLTYAVDTWQKWTLLYVIGDNKFGVCLNATCVTGLDSFSSGVAGFVGMGDMVDNVAGSYFVDSVATPIPGALPLFASGLGLLGLIAHRRKRKAAPTAAC
jgi:hypothetical protein